MVGSPILVTGAPRSGTTWVGKMLAQAPGLGYIHEPFNPLTDPGTSGGFTHFLARVTDRTEAEGAPHAAALERCLAFRYDWRRQLPAVRGPRQAARTARDAARWARWRAGRARPLVKDPIALLSAPWLADRFEMDVVVTIRRPTAFVASFKRLGWSHDFTAMSRDEELMSGLLAPYRAQVRQAAERPSADLVDQATLLWLLLHTVVARYQVDHPDWCFVRQEDLSRNPPEGFSLLYQALDLTMSDSAMAAVRAHSSTANPERLRRTHDTRLDSAASLESWRKELDETETARIEAATAELTRHFYPEG